MCLLIYVGVIYMSLHAYHICSVTYMYIHLLKSSMLLFHALPLCLLLRAALCCLLQLAY